MSTLNNNGAPFWGPPSRAGVVPASFLGDAKASQLVGEPHHGFCKGLGGLPGGLWVGKLGCEKI